MLRSLCFLRYLTKFNIKEALNREIRLHQFDDNVLIDHQDVAFCWEFLTKEKDDLKSFNEFVKEENENIKNCNLLGLKTAAEEEIKYEIIKDALKVFIITSADNGLGDVICFIKVIDNAYFCFIIKFWDVNSINF